MRPRARSRAEHFVISRADRVIAEGRGHHVVDKLRGCGHIHRSRLTQGHSSWNRTGSRSVQHEYTLLILCRGTFSRTRIYGVPGPPLAVYRKYGYAHTDHLPAATDCNTFDRRNIGVVAAPGQRDMAGVHHLIVGGIQIKPAQTRVEHRYPGVRRLDRKSTRLNSSHLGTSHA